MEVNETSNATGQVTGSWRNPRGVGVTGSDGENDGPVVLSPSRSSAVRGAVNRGKV